MHLDIMRRVLLVMSPISFADARQGWVHNLMRNRTASRPTSPAAEGSDAMAITDTSRVRLLSIDVPASQLQQLLKHGLSADEQSPSSRLNRTKRSLLPRTTSQGVQAWRAVVATAVNYSCEVYRSPLVHKLNLKRCRADHMAKVCRSGVRDLL